MIAFYVFGEQDGEAATEEVKKSKRVLKKLEKRQQDRKLDPHIEEQFGGGRLLACISSRPGQCGRCDGYVTFNPLVARYMELNFSSTLSDYNFKIVSEVKTFYNIFLSNQGSVDHSYVQMIISEIYSPKFCTLK